MRRALIATVAATVGLVSASAAYGFGFSTSPASVTTPAITLNGDDQTTSWTETITVTGAGSGGWNFTAWAAVPTATGGLTLGALTVPSQPTAAPCTGGPSCSQPVPTGITWPVTLDTTGSSPSKFFNAGTGTGRGNVVLTATFSVPVPANALPGTYTTTVTIIGSSSGP
jgi:hypothetical protein